MDFDRGVKGALSKVQQEWTSADSYATKISRIRNGSGALNAPYQFKSGVTVFNDTSIDQLTGGAGLDWFFAKTGVDVITDKNNGGPETVDAL